jgi:hypothetical protein
MSDQADGTVGSAEAVIPAVYRPAFTKNQMELVTSIVCNIIAWHLADSGSDGLAFVQTDPGTAKEFGTSVPTTPATRDAFKASAMRGVHGALHRFRAREGELAFDKLSGDLSRLLRAAITQEGK